MTHLTLLDQAVFVLAAVVLFTCFALLTQARLVATLRTFAWQGGLVAAVTALMAAAHREPHLYVTAALTLVLKAGVIPWMLHRWVRRLGLDRHVESLASPLAVTLAGVGLVIFCYWVVLPIERMELTATRNVIAVSLAVVVLGLLMMVTRRNAVSQVVGFMSLENGLVLAAAGARGMPLAVEISVAFSVLIALFVFGVFVFRIRERFDSVDIEALEQVRGDAR